MTPLDHGIPVLRMTLEGMKFNILRALTGHEHELAEQTRLAVEKFCTPENLQAIIWREVDREMERAIAEAVQDYYRNGKGRAQVRAQVIRLLGGEPT